MYTIQTGECHSSINGLNYFTADYKTRTVIKILKFIMCTTIFSVENNNDCQMIICTVTLSISSAS